MTRIALGHHGDDMMETLFLNMFHGGQLKSMPPKLRSDDGNHVVVRPLAYCREKDIARYAALRGISHHSLQPLWIARTSPAESHKKYALRVGAFTPGSHRQHL